MENKKYKIICENEFMFKIKDLQKYIEESPDILEHIKDCVPIAANFHIIKTKNIIKICNIKKWFGTTTSTYCLNDFISIKNINPLCKLLFNDKDYDRLVTIIQIF